MSQVVERPLSQRAGILCNEDRFQRFAAEESGFRDGQFSASAAAEYLRQVCGIESRRELDTDPRARAEFSKLRTEYDAWCGKIPNQR